MGYGDNEPPAIRADAFAATLQHPSGFKMLFLTFVNWDVIKLSWMSDGGDSGGLEIDSGAASTDFVFQPARSGDFYCFSAQGCSKAADGSTNYCSPVSGPLCVAAAVNTNSVRQFLTRSGIVVADAPSLRTLLAAREVPISLREAMGLG